MNYAQIYFKKKRAFFERITKSKVLFSVLLGVNLAIFFIFAIALSRSAINDPPVSVTPFAPSVLSDQKNIVDVGLYIQTFQKFEMMENNFIVDATVWFRYDQDQVPFILIDEFKFENAHILSKSDPYKIIEGNNKVFVSYDIQLGCRGDFDYQYYPFDRHRLSLVLINKNASLDQLIYVSQDNLVVNEAAFTQDWQVTGLDTVYGTAQSNFFMGANKKEITYERVVFSIDFKRTSLKSVFIVFIPLFLVFAVGLLSLTFDVLSQFRFILTLSLGSTTALIFFSSSLAKMAPTNGAFTLADMIYVLLLILVITTLTLQIAAMHYLQNKMRATKLDVVINETIMFINIIRSLLFLFFLFLMFVMVAWIMLL